MANLGRYKVANEHGIVENALRGKDHEPHQSARLVHLEEGEEVHALVVRLFEQCLDPPLVGLEAADGVQVAEGSRHHAWDAGDGFEEDEADEL